MNLNNFPSSSSQNGTQGGGGLHYLTVGHSNIQGGMTGISKTNDIIDIIREHGIDIMSLNETNLNEGIDTSTLNIPHSHDFIRKDRGTGSRGGCGLLVSKNCNYSVYKMNVTMEK